MNPATLDECRRRLRYGLIPAVPVPFTIAGQMDAAAQERYVAFMARQPIAGVAVWAHTGRGLHISREQRRQVLRSWREGLGDRTIVVAGVGGSPANAADWAAYLDSAVAMADDAREGGAHALLVHPPRLFHHVAEDGPLILEYHQQLAAVGRPLILFYLYEAAGGFSYPPETLRELLAMPQVLGIKLATLDNVMTYQGIANLLRREFPEKLLITGEDRFLGYSLMCGGEAALIGMGAVCTSLQHDLLQSYFEGRAAQFLRLSQAVDRLAQVLFVPPMEGYIGRILWALVHMGVVSRAAACDPWGPALDEREFPEIGNVLKELGQLSSAPAARH